MNNLFFLLCMLFPSLLWGNATVRFFDQNDVEVFGSDTTSFPSGQKFKIEVEENSDGTSENSAAVAYIPFTNSAFTDTGVNACNLADAGPRCFFAEHPQTLLPLDTTGQLSVHLKLTNTNVDTHYLYVAYKDSSDKYRIVGPSYLTSVPSSTNNLDYMAIFNFSSLCGRVNASLDCTKFTAESDDESLLFFFLTNNNAYASDIDIDESNFDGVYIDAKFSNRVNTETDINLSDLRRGDKNLRAVYSGRGISSMLGVYALVRKTPYTGGGNLTTAGFSDATELYDFGVASFSGTAKIPNLTNDQQYFVTIGFKDRYHFMSELSNVDSETPQSIAALLESQACYILSAGFGEEHPVVDYFQRFRDDVLSRFWVGKKFIKWYYQTAPLYTSYILKSPTVAKLIRIFAMAMYIFLNYWKIFLLTLVCVGVGAKYYSFRKAELQK